MSLIENFRLALTSSNRLLVVAQKHERAAGRAEQGVAALDLANLPDELPKGIRLMLRAREFAPEHRRSADKLRRAAEVSRIDRLLNHY